MVSTSHDIKTTETQEHLIYVGPTIRSPHPVRQYSVFKALPPAIREWKAGDRNVDRLFIPVGGLATARVKLKDKQSVLGRAFASVQATYGKVG